MSSDDMSGARVRKAQSAFEFVIVIGFVLLFFVLILALIFQNVDTAQRSGAQSIAETLSAHVMKELSLAKTIQGNYARDFNISIGVNDLEYSYSLFRGRELKVIGPQESSALVFLPGYTYGTIHPGQNRLIKRGSAIGICQPSCSESDCISCDEDVLFNITGDIQCAVDDGLWQSCNLQFNTYVSKMRVACSSGNVDLLVLNADDELTIFEKTAAASGGFAEFSTKFTVNESGVWELHANCPPNVPMLQTQYVPYGRFNLIAPTIGRTECGDPMNNTYYCPSDEFFTLTAKIECVGGECGNATVWVDPN